jgi:hypothetical protein
MKTIEGNLEHQHSYTTSEISYQILGYLLDNPDAQDTLEGITEWWLLHQDIKRNASLILKVLTELTQKEFLIDRRGYDRRNYYRINPNKYREISELLAKRKEHTYGE